MRQRNSDLQELIQSLDRSETQFCLARLKEYPAQNRPRLLLLFNGLHQPGNASEEKLKSTLLKKNPGWDFAHYKNLLTALVHQSLTGFRKSDTVENHLLYLLELEKVLYGKNLFVQCSRLLADAREQAEKYEYHLTELELLKRQGALLKDLFPDDFRNELNRIAARRKELNRLIANETEYRTLCEVIFLLKRKYNLCRTAELKKELLKIQHNTLLKNKNKALNFRSQRFYYNAQSHLNELLGNHEKSFEYLKQNNRLWQDHVHQQKEKSDAYRAFLIHFCNTCFLLDRYVAAKEILTLAQNITVHGTTENARWFWQIKLNQLLLCLNTADFANLPTLLSEIKKGLKTYKVPDSFALSLIHNAAVCCFVIDDYAEALRWLLRINEFGRTGERQDIRDFSLLFTLVAWYGAGKHDLVENHLRSAKRFYKKTNLLYPLETVILSLLNQLLTTSSLADTKRIAQAMQPQFAQLKNRPLGTAELNMWLQSMAKAKPMQKLC